MTITTKLNVGDSAYFMHNDLVECRKVHKIEVTSTEYWTSVHYHFDGSSSDSSNNRGKVQIIKNEKQVFSTKKELLESL